MCVCVCPWYSSMYINMASVTPVPTVIPMPFLHSLADRIYIAAAGKFCSLLRSVLLFVCFW